jgi:DNA-binding response OmpR family regulator
MGTRILIVDDEQDTLNLLRTIMMISGFDPITTLNSVEAIGLAEREKPDVVLLDVMMPRLDGFTLCKLMRRRESTMNIPVIFVTAYESLDLEERRIEAGGSMVVRKPIDFDVLMQTIDKILKERPDVVPAPTSVSMPPQAAAAETPEREKPSESPSMPVPTLEASPSVQALPGATETQEHTKPSESPSMPVPALEASPSVQAVPGTTETQEHETTNTKPSESQP